ncbi:MAG: hypothetical protein E7Z72_05825 [Methanocorpusculum parvum]|nr:hypothetical protein [Methanocorpusculum parvum]
MKAVVLYQSKYGSTKQYAEWIAKELGADIFPANACLDVSSYDTIIFGAPVFGGTVMGIAAVSNLPLSKEQRLFLFTVGLTAPDAEKNLENLREKNFSEAVVKRAEIFHFQGALEYKKLTLHHKILLKMINSTMRNKLDLNQNHVAYENILPLIEAVGRDFDE